MDSHDRSNTAYRLVAPRLGKGFTLIELLVVVGIIALLMAILLPALGRARQEAVKVSCAANLRQWGAGLQMWASDHNNQLITPVADPNYWGSIMGIDSVYDDPPQDIYHFFSSYMADYDLDDVEDFGNSPAYCPSGPEIRRPESQSFTNIGYGYFPHRQGIGGMTFEPEVQGWVSKTRYDGPYSRAPIMSDLYTETGGELDEPRSSHLASSGDGRLGSNFLFEDSSVSWRSNDEISQAAVFANAHAKLFYISVPGLVD
ncbi:MAG: type II secretion system protein [Phycisphaeraceae bacterium]